MKPDHNVVFSGAIPENYDRYLGPAFFEPFARDMVNRLGPIDQGALLEIACGTGIVTRRLRDALPEGVAIVATDLNPDMFEFAKPKFKKDEQVEWKQADALALPFPDGSFNVVVCQFGAMFFPDKETAFREWHRVLRTGGVLLFSVWDSFAFNPIGEIAHTTISSFFDNDPPKFYQLPYGYYDEELIRGLLGKSGFAGIQMSRVNLPCRNTSAREFATGLVRGNPVGNECAERGVDQDKVIEAVSKRIAERFGAAPVEATMQALVWRAVRA